MAMSEDKQKLTNEQREKLRELIRAHYAVRAAIGYGFDAHAKLHPSTHEAEG